jgi:probable FeS assembly SUF system protein SufT
MFGQDSEPVTFTRDCKAIIVPAGDQVILRKGARGLITQALCGSFTVYLDGNLFRIAGEDADALGKSAVLPPQLPPDAGDEDVEQLVWEQLRTCFDPEIPINVVDLGLIYECKLKSAEEGLRDVEVKMTLTAPGCGMGEILVMDVKDKLEIIPTVREARVELTFDPPWHRDMMSEAARLQTGMY